MRNSLIPVNVKVQIKNKHEESYYLSGLSFELAKDNSTKLISLINIIPYIDWTENDLLENNNEQYKYKWNLSLLIRNSKDEIVGLILSYLRKSDEKHIFDSLYIHKLVLEPSCQCKGLGSSALKAFIYLSFSKIPWLYNISVQTNDEIKNNYVISYYEKLGFCNQYNIKYQNKIDKLLLYTRDIFEKSNFDIFFQNDNIDNTFISISHPRLINSEELVEIPTLYFSTSNKTKQGLNKYIFNNYNFNLVLFPQKYKLFEPQVEQASLEEERSLVESPLKSVSRFLEKTGKIPFYVEDTMLFLEYFNQDYIANPELPGHDTKRWWRQIGDNGIVNIIGNSSKRKARFVSQIGAYIGRGKYIYGRGFVDGTISIEPRVSEVALNEVPRTYPFYFHTIFIPNGAEKTLAEMNAFEFSQHDYVRKCIQNFIANISNESIFRNEINLFNYLKINGK